MRLLIAFALSSVLLCAPPPPQAGAAGTVDGTVTDPSGAAIPGATVSIKAALTGYHRSTTTDATGAFHFPNVPLNTYHLEATSTGFTATHQDVQVRSTVPISLTVRLEIAGSETSVTVESGGADFLENVAYAHNDVDRATLDKLPVASPGAALSDAITLSTPGVVADSNGFFHPLGDHAQTTYSIDGQPVSDQQSKQFSIQMPLNAIQSMELITGAPSAEFGDKTSLVVNATTRSGLGQRKPTGNLNVGYGSFGTVSEDASLGWGTEKLGNFLVANTLRSGRFLDTPEFRPLHAIGNNETIFDRLDYQPTGKDGLHLNLLQARNWFQIPNTYDQPLQDQRQKIVTYNIAPGYQHTFNASTLFSINGFFRQDQVRYYPSRNLFEDTPLTVSQARRLTNYGVKGDTTYAGKGHNLKVGIQVMHYDLNENFTLGITDPLFNSLCVSAAGVSQVAANVRDPNQCAAAGFQPNPDLAVGLVPFDLTRGGGLFAFHGNAGINEVAFYIQDTISIGNLSLSPGVRIDHYAGLTTDNAVEPRIGISYQVKPTKTVVRASYSRTFETPYNENLVLTSSTGQGGLAQNIFGATSASPLKPGIRNQYNAGFEQSVGKFLLVDLDYFWKGTDNAFDFSNLLNTPIQFPIAWRKSKNDGFSGRLSTPNLHGLQASVTFGHTRARYFAPATGGLVFDSPLNTSVFRIDHDEVFEQSTVVRYQRPHNGLWTAFTWRYDSGQVAGAVESMADALALTAAEQSAIGLSCGGVHANLGQAITSCSPADFHVERLRIPAEGTANPDTNPPRIAPRNLFDVAVGTDNLFHHTEGPRMSLRLSAVNVTNQVALYNFLSTFSGTHFVAPRSLQAEVGWTF